MLTFREKVNAGRTLVAIFWAAIFLNASLLFSVQPLFTKMVLPLLGGTPAVWNTCLLFFQTALLAGYFYAHLLSRRDIRTQAGIHLSLLGIAMLLLPIAVPKWWSPPPDTALPIWWLLALLTVSLGLPFFALSAGAPMLQRWFATTTHAHADNPYFLYAASNLGSFAALIAYPFVIEPYLSITKQSVFWFQAYMLLLGLIAVAAITAVATKRLQSVEVPSTPGTSIPPITVRQRILWLLLSFAPSSLLIGVTTYFTTDIASVPLLWIVPLAIYLLTFVLVFARRQFIPRSLIVHAQLLLGLPLLIALCLRSRDAIIGPAVLHLLAFFATAMMCHGELADRRPHAAHLTEFYLWVSLGGVLGGVFNVLIAPLVFVSLAEYPVALAIAFALRPPQTTSTRLRDRIGDLAYPAVMAGLVWIVFRLPFPPSEWFEGGPLIFLLGLMFAVFFFWKRPARLALGAIALYASVTLVGVESSDILFKGRSFFGTYRVRRVNDVHVLQHGTTAHGAQNRLQRTTPLTYYSAGGPVSDLFQNVVLKARRRVGIVGLGTGTMACYGRPNEIWTFYEIDPVVARIARSPELFSFMKDCPPRIDVVMGDARLRIAAAPDDQFDIIVIDAFSSDAVPAHLLTKEAVRVYLDKLHRDGVLAFHISNRFLDLAPVLSALARDAGLFGAIAFKSPGAGGASMLQLPSRWVALAREKTTLEGLLETPGWQPLATVPPSRLWTDDHTDVVSAIRWRLGS